MMKRFGSDVNPNPPASELLQKSKDQRLYNYEEEKDSSIKERFKEEVQGTRVPQLSK